MDKEAKEVDVMSMGAIKLAIWRSILFRNVQ
jgi:hypothetical protein